MKMTTVNGGRTLESKEKEWGWSGTPKGIERNASITSDKDRLLSTYMHTEKTLTPHLFGLGYSRKPFPLDNFTRCLYDKWFRSLTLISMTSVRPFPSFFRWFDHCSLCMLDIISSIFIFFWISRFQTKAQMLSDTRQAKSFPGKRAKVFIWEKIVLPFRVTLPAEVRQLAPRVVSPPLDELHWWSSCKRIHELSSSMKNRGEDCRWE